jgi:hypothetical protein
LTLPTPTEQNSYAIWFSGAEGLFGGANMLRTSDYGFNWSSVTTLGTGNFGGITGTHIPVNSPVIYEMLHYVRSDNKIYFTTSNATNWQIIYTSPNGIYTYITSIRSGVGSPFWAIRNNGGISYRDRMGGIKIINSNTPETYTLYQNYPNPFNPRTVFRFALSIAGMTNLRVFYILGRGVTTLLTEQLKPGTYEVDFDGTNYPSGVYFYKLETGKFVKTKKMVLIK